MCVHGALRGAKRHLKSKSNTKSRLRLSLVYFSRAVELLDMMTEHGVDAAVGDRVELCDMLLRTTKLMMVTRCRLEAER